MKVYCNNCKYIWDGSEYYCEDRCHHPTNMERVDKPTHWYMCSIKSLEILNESNNCEWYKRKWWKFWIK